jgi:hypothetical protein
MSELDKIELFDEINNGLFKTDRITIDSRFEVDLASKRYINWLLDEENKSKCIYKLILKGRNIGFVALKKLTSEIYYPFLAGLYNKYNNLGLGFCTLSKSIEIVNADGGRKIETFVSSNNINVAKTHLEMGFKLMELNYIFVKKNENYGI